LFSFFHVSSFGFYKRTHDIIRKRAGVFAEACDANVMHRACSFCDCREERDGEQGGFVPLRNAFLSGKLSLINTLSLYENKRIVAPYFACRCMGDLLL
jgi:hypothetical protein